MDLVLFSINIDHVFWPENSTQEVFSIIAQPLIISVMEGYNGIAFYILVSVFCYGQTGTGKTYTMYGDINTVFKKQTIESWYCRNFI